MEYVSLSLKCVSQIISTASAISNLVQKVKANKKQCHRIGTRVEALQGVVLSATERKTVLKTKEVEKALSELADILKSAQEEMEKYTEASKVIRVLKSGDYKAKFEFTNERLDDAFKHLSLAINLEQNHTAYQVFKESERKTQDELDRRADEEELKTLLLEEMEALSKDVKTILEKLDKPSSKQLITREIPRHELAYDPKKPLKNLTTSNAQVYKGTYSEFITVAIKRFSSVNANPNKIRDDFEKDFQTMRHFESPNILRMYGICFINENGPNPEYLIIMEYCEKGCLRDVLDDLDCELSWITKARMCLDAARGLYRLHKATRDIKSKVHGCINSSKYLVDEHFRVKLGSFELAKTETSLRKGRDDDEIRMCYYSPQLFGNSSYYSNECEIYSFGIVMWEIATRQHPFKGLSDKEIQQKVCEDKDIEDIEDENCPEVLRDLINDCRSYMGFDRPSPAVLVEKLQSVVEN